MRLRATNSTCTMRSERFACTCDGPTLSDRIGERTVVVGRCTVTLPKCSKGRASSVDTGLHHFDTVAQRGGAAARHYSAWHIHMRFACTGWPRSDRIGAKRTANGGQVVRECARKVLQAMSHFCCQSVKVVQKCDMACKTF